MDEFNVVCKIPSKFDPGLVQKQSRVRILNGKIQWDGKQFNIIVTQGSEMFWL